MGRRLGCFLRSTVNVVTLPADIVDHFRREKEAGVLKDGHLLEILNNVGRGTWVVRPGLHMRYRSGMGSCKQR